MGPQMSTSACRGFFPQHLGQAIRPFLSQRNRLCTNSTQTAALRWRQGKSLPASPREPQLHTKCTFALGRANLFAKGRNVLPCAMPTDVKCCRMDTCGTTWHPFRVLTCPSEDMLPERKLSVIVGRIRAN